jgi:hypothetical protein
MPAFPASAVRASLPDARANRVDYQEHQEHGHCPGVQLVLRTTLAGQELRDQDSNLEPTG